MCYGLFYGIVGQIASATRTYPLGHWTCHEYGVNIYVDDPAQMHGSGTVVINGESVPFAVEIHPSAGDLLFCRLDEADCADPTGDGLLLRGSFVLTEGGRTMEYWCSAGREGAAAFPEGDFRMIFVFVIDPLNPGAPSTFQD